ncbi:MAG: hypothetical protein RIT28_1928 [Pseudomonadota bacterium]|jgi:hypothetical protein
MNDPKKAFDPLASLFDGPNLRAIAAATALNAYADDGLDSFLGASYPTEEAEDEGDAPSPVGEIGGWDQVLAALPPPPPSALRAATPRPIEAPPVVEVPVPVEEPAPVAAAPEAPAEPTIADKLALARSLAQAAMARAKGLSAEPPPKAAPPPAPELDKAALAKALAKAAMARAKATPPPAAAPAPAPAPAAPVASAPPPKKAGLASRAQRPMSALEAAQAAAESERRRKAAEQIHAVRDLAVQVAGLLRRQLPSASKLEIVNALVLDDRTTSRALWKGHRAKFAAQGALDQVVATTNVLRALDAVAEGQLVASIVETETTEYLVWVDLGSQATIAAFSNARSWYAGVRS